MTLGQFPCNTSVALEPSPGNYTCELCLGKQFMSYSSFETCLKRMSWKVYYCVNSGIKDLFFPLMFAYFLISF